MGFTAALPKSTIERIFDKLFEELKNDKKFEDLLKDENFQQYVKENIFEAINSQRLTLSALKDPEFTRQFTMALMANYLMQKYNGPVPNLKLFFMKKEDDPLAYEIELRKMFKLLLVERNKLEPDKVKLNDNQIDQLVNAYMKSNDPTKMLALLINDLTVEQLQKNQADVTLENDLTKTEEMKEIKRNERETRLVGDVIPIQHLKLSHVAGHLTPDVLVRPGILSLETLEKLISHAGFAINKEAYDLRLDKK